MLPGMGYLYGKHTFHNAQERFPSSQLISWSHDYLIKQRMDVLSHIDEGAREYILIATVSVFCNHYWKFVIDNYTFTAAKKFDLI